MTLEIDAVRLPPLPLDEIMAGGGNKAFGLSIGIAAYMLDMRHAFDADHIAAIDSTTRKLMREGKRSSSVGFWFSLGHSSLIFGLTALLAFGIRSVAQPVLNHNSELHHITGLIGPMVSSGFLYLVAAMNAVVLLDVWNSLCQVRAGRSIEAAPEMPLATAARDREKRPVVTQLHPCECLVG
jgi:nickel/cobalt transporter (NiCoT) family protein